MSKSRKDYLKSMKNVVELQVNNEKDVEEVLNLIEKGTENLLVNFDQISLITEYVKFKLVILNYISEIIERKSIEEFEKNYKELTIDQKRTLSKKIPEIKFEM